MSFADTLGLFAVNSYRGVFPFDSSQEAVKRPGHAIRPYNYEHFVVISMVGEGQGFRNL